MKLTSEQLAAVKAVPLGEQTNRLRIAFAVADTKQSQACDETGLAPSAMSKLVRGAYSTLDLEDARKLADYFGCAVEDLFPPRAKAEVA